MGKNWNSKTGKFEQIKSQEIKDLADKAKRLKAKGYSVSEIAEEFGLSKGRIYEYLK
jgi:transposase